MSALLELEAPARAALREVDCGLCGSARRTTRFTEPPFAVVRCDDCGLVYVTPRLPDRALIESVYAEHYWRSPRAREHGYGDYLADEPLYLRTFRRRARLVRRHLPRFDGGRPGRVLDVGCAAGFFLRVMRDAGWDVHGVEPSEPMHRRAAGELGPERLYASLDDVGLEPGSFDLVTLWDVLEHTPDPVATLRRARELLKPDGRLVLETQNVASPAARLLGRRWQHYKHAEHLYHFDPRSLGRALDRAGFELLENRPWLGGKYVSPAFVVERARRIGPWLSFLLRPLALLGARGIYVNLLDEMVAVAAPLAEPGGDPP